VRKLKTYTTSAGFFDLAVAAPSMKAALAAWGAERNLFHQGFARQTDDAGIVAATTAVPGRVLRRPVGTNEAFSENAKLPNHLGSGEGNRESTKLSAKSPKRPKPAQRTHRETRRKQALAYEREQKRRERQAHREEAAREKKRQRQSDAIEAAEAALAKGTRAHRSALADIEKAQQVVDKRKLAEAARWHKQEEKLESALRRARSGHLKLI